MDPVQPRLKYKFPTWKSSRAFSICVRLFVITEPVRPYSVLLAISIACSIYFDGVKYTTGPNISYCFISDCGSTIAHKINVIYNLVVYKTLHTNVSTD